MTKAHGAQRRTGQYKTKGVSPRSNTDRIEHLPEDVLLPRHKPAAERERALLLAIIEMAMLDLTKYGPATWGKHPRRQVDWRSARDFLCGSAQFWEFCAVLGLPFTKITAWATEYANASESRRAPRAIVVPRVCRG